MRKRLEAIAVAFAGILDSVITILTLGYCHSVFAFSLASYFTKKWIREGMK